MRRASGLCIRQGFASSPASSIISQPLPARVKESLASAIPTRSPRFFWCRVLPTTVLVASGRNSIFILVNAIGATTRAYVAVLVQRSNRVSEQPAGPGPWPLQAFPEEFLAVAALLRSLQIVLSVYSIASSISAFSSLGYITSCSSSCSSGCDCSSALSASCS